MNKPNTIYFVWVKGLSGPTCEINYDIDNEYRKTPILQKHELLTEYRDLSLKQLELIYPYKGGEA